jgi:hypothetical protein
MTPRSKTPEYSRTYDRLRREVGYKALRDGTITRRKLAALHALGYSWAYIGERLGRSQQSISKTLRHDTPVHWKTERAVASLYEELHLTHPEGPYAHRTRLRAQREGFAPPAAWDRIEDIHERPKGVLKA